MAIRDLLIPEFDEEVKKTRTISAAQLVRATYGPSADDRLGF